MSVMRGSSLVPFALVGTVLLACEVPSSLRIDVLVREPELRTIRLHVTRDPSGASERIATCVLHPGERPEAGCPLEGGSERWEGGSELGFLVYGRPSTALEIVLEGWRVRDTTGPAATATSARISLPEAPGMQQRLSLDLASRTSARFRCTAEITAAGNDRSAITIAPAETSHLLATSAGVFSLLRYERGVGTCSLTEISRIEAQCSVQANGVVVSPVEARGGVTFAASCANVRDPGEVQLFAGLADQNRPTATLRLPGSANQLSKPALADLDGDGLFEVFVLTSTGGMALIEWQPASSSSQRTRIPLPGLAAFNNGAVTLGPIVVPLRTNTGARTQDVLLIAGYPGGIGIVFGSPPQFRLVHADARAPLMSSGVTVMQESGAVRITVATLYTQGSMSFTTLIGGNRGWRERETFSVETPAGTPISAARDVRIAFGDLDGSGRTVAVIAQNGKIIAYPLEQDAVPIVRDAWGSEISGVQSVLLANIDGAPGAEMLVFDPASPFVHAIDGSGRVLDGWPIVAIEGGALRTLVSDLDAAASDPEPGDLEVVSLSQGLVQVTVLGPGSYDPEATPWPLVFRDSRGSSAHGPGELDPRLVQPVVVGP